MSETLADADGAPHAGHVRLYATFAAGGSGTVVTGNVRHFSRIPDLSVESWLVP